MKARGRRQRPLQTGGAPQLGRALPPRDEGRRRPGRARPRPTPSPAAPYARPPARQRTNSPVVCVAAHPAGDDERRAHLALAPATAGRRSRPATASVVSPSPSRWRPGHRRTCSPSGNRRLPSPHRPESLLSPESSGPSPTTDARSGVSPSDMGQHPPQRKIPTGRCLLTVDPSTRDLHGKLKTESICQHTEWVILSAAAKVFEERGFQAATISEIPRDGRRHPGGPVPTPLPRVPGPRVLYEQDQQASRPGLQGPAAHRHRDAARLRLADRPMVAGRVSGCRSISRPTASTERAVRALVPDSQDPAHRGPGAEASCSGGDHETADVTVGAFAGVQAHVAGHATTTTC